MVPQEINHPTIQQHNLELRSMSEKRALESQTKNQWLANNGVEEGHDHDYDKDHHDDDHNGNNKGN